MTFPNLTQRHGFTLMEVLVVIGILGILGGSIFTFLLSSQVFSDAISTRTELNDVANRALIRISELLMQTAQGKFSITGGEEYQGHVMKFRIPYVVNNQVQTVQEGENKGKIIWGSTNFEGGVLVIEFIDQEGLQQEEYQWSDGYFHFTKAPNSKTIILALKRYLSGLIIPCVYAGQDPEQPGDFKNVILLREYRGTDANGQPVDEEEQNRRVLAYNATGLNFHRIEEKLEITIQTEKTNWQKRTIGVSKKTWVNPRN